MPDWLGRKVRAALVPPARAALSFLGHAGLDAHWVCSAASTKPNSTQAVTLPSRGVTVSLSGPLCSATL